MDDRELKDEALSDVSGGLTGPYCVRSPDRHAGKGSRETDGGATRRPEPVPDVERELKLPATNLMEG